jgi:glutamyl-tRNA synthetase
MKDDALAKLAAPFFKDILGRELNGGEIETLAKALPDIKPRVQLVKEIAAAAAFYFRARPLALDDKAKKQITDESRKILSDLSAEIEKAESFTHDELEKIFRAYAEKNGLKLGGVAQPFRAALTGSTVSPPIFAVAQILGKVEVLERLADAIG